MKFYPAFIDIQGKNCLVVRGGNVASRKIQALRRAKASIIIISPTLNPRLRQLVRSGRSPIVE